MSEDFFDFIWQHREEDPHALALSAKKHPDVPVALAAAQVKALQKVRQKIPSWYKPGMDFPLPLALEQASSEQAAQFKAALFSGKKMADLTGGLGVDAFFFSRQFESLHYVEQNAELFAATRHNFARLGVRNAHFEQNRAEDFLANTSERFDLLYLDPARRDAHGARVAGLEDCSPNVLAIKNLLLKKSSRVLLKTAPMLDVKQAVAQLQAVTKIWVLALEGECREVLYLLEHSPQPALEIPIKAVAIAGGETREFTFNWAEEQHTAADFSLPQEFLYEPNPAILKAGAFRTFARRFALAKLHANTHLYTSTGSAVQIPGRRFRIEKICRYERKAVQAALPQLQANVSCRNFPDNPDQVRKRLGLADGGEFYLFAVTTLDERRVVLVCRKV